MTAFNLVQIFEHALSLTLLLFPALYPSSEAGPHPRAKPGQARACADWRQGALFFGCRSFSEGMPSALWLET